MIDHRDRNQVATFAIYSLMPARSSRKSRPVAGDTKTILVAQSDPLLRMAVADYLRQCGYKVLEAISSDEALAILKGDTVIHAVLSDVKLQGELDGFRLAQWLRKNHPSIDVILTSGIALAVQKAADLCEDAPLEKPYHPQELAKRLQILFAKRRAGRRT
jgi:DNA-binding response OmpR family regulator